MHQAWFHYIGDNEFEMRIVCLNNTELRYPTTVEDSYQAKENDLQQENMHNDGINKSWTRILSIPNAKNGQTLVKNGDKFGKLAFDIDFHPSDNLVAAGLITGDLHLYRYSANSVPMGMLEVHAHTESCGAARFINSGRGDDDGCIKVWDTRERSCCNSFNAHEDYISDMTFTSDAMKLLATSDRFIDLSSNSIDAMLKLDEDRIITGSENGIINLVGILPNRVIQPIAEHSEYPVECLAFSHDRKFLGSIAHDQMLKLWDLDNILQGSRNTQRNEAGDIDSDDDEMDLDDDPKISRGNKRKNANNGHALGGSNNFFADL
ncbi:WD repeat-containing protein 55-like [Spatholobus suberectus]|nr:WD repeat-containing protein 55-like [Spatholobus suberectus]